MAAYANIKHQLLLLSGRLGCGKDYGTMILDFC